MRLLETKKNQAPHLEKRTSLAESDAIFIPEDVLTILIRNKNPSSGRW